MQNVKITLVIFMRFRTENTIRYDLYITFTKNVKVVTEYGNVITGVIVVTIHD